jgi:hypothetical protein
LTGGYLAAERDSETATRDDDLASRSDGGPH